MMTKAYELMGDPSHALYRNLIEFALGRYPLALLVLRFEVELTVAGQSVLRSLGPYMESKEKSSRWPGTELFDAEASLFSFRLETGSARLLQAATDHLFGWCQPGLPEDLCILREDRTPWLVTIAHERDGYFLLNEGELHQLLNALRDLRVVPSSK